MCCLESGLPVHVAELDALRVVQAVNQGKSLAAEGALMDDILRLLAATADWKCRHVHMLASFAFLDLYRKKIGLI
ncbi:hypothetical protein L484_021643 [Morus notabilis]|uniref:Uncharacterized protein n=1 Tax=Morus notabilis TaxID=981085 RepID=W9SH58_9ROSA|nr:hypothetical protein L484_021643 [Morus notabilis]